MALAVEQSITQPHAGMSAYATRWIAALIVGAHVVLALMWSFAVPLGEGPDEPGHFDYALFVAREGRLPVQQADPEQSDVPGEGHQPPFAYWLLQPAVRWLPDEARVLEMGSNPRFRWNGGDEPNAYFRSSREFAPYTGIALAWHLARGVSALLGGVTVALTVLLARRWFPAQPWVALGAAALVAFNPQFIYAHALVSNDPLLIALASGLIYASLALLGDRDRRRWPLVAGVVLGLMLNTKLSALAFVPLPFVALTLRRPPIKAWVIDAATIIGVAALLSGWWFVRNARLYGDPLGLTAFQQTFATGDFAAASLESWRSGLWNMLRSSWGMFGWITIALSDGAYWAIATLLVLALIGLVASVGVGWWSNRGWVAAVLIAAGALAFGWTVAFAQTAGAVAWQGRFLFPAVSALAVLGSIGLGAVLPLRSALWSLVALLITWSVALPYGLIAPAYTSYVLPPQPADAGNTYARFDVGWKRGVELRDVRYLATVPAASTLELVLTWHALEQLDRPWHVFVHVIDADGSIVAERNAEPVDGAFPINRWVGGDWVRDASQVPLIGVPPGTYRVEIGLFDPETTQRLGVYDRQSQLFGDRVDVGSITVLPKQP